MIKKGKINFLIDNLSKYTYEIIHVIKMISNLVSNVGYKCTIEPTDINDSVTFECLFKNNNGSNSLEEVSIKLIDNAISIENNGTFKVSEYGYIIDNISSLGPIPINLTIKVNEFVFDNELTLDSHEDITIITRNNIIFKDNSYVIKKGQGGFYLKAGLENFEGKVIFPSTNKKYIYMQDSSKLIINYHPEPLLYNIGYSHKYHNPYNYSKHVNPINSVKAYMLVNNCNDLQNMNLYLHGDYALSQDINAFETKFWNNGAGFNPLKLDLREYPTPFSGNFDGNGYKISNLYINRPSENFVGLFGLVKGCKAESNLISNLSLNNLSINGSKYVGGITGYAQNTSFSNIILKRMNVMADEIAGGMIGSGQNLNIDKVNCSDLSIFSKEINGRIIGGIKTYNITNVDECCILGEHLNNAENDCFGFIA